MAEKDKDELVKQVTEASFAEEVLAAKGAVLVDFWAEWCGPCRAVGPLLERIAGEQAGKLVIAKVDVDANPGLAATYGIRSIPTMMLFKDGAAVATRIGAAPKAVLDNWVRESV